MVNDVDLLIQKVVFWKQISFLFGTFAKSTSNDVITRIIFFKNV